MVPSASAGSPELLEPVPQSLVSDPDRVPKRGYTAATAVSCHAGLLWVRCGTRPLGAQSCYNCNKLPGIGAAAALSGPANVPSYGDPTGVDPYPTAGVLLVL